MSKLNPDLRGYIVLFKEDDAPPADPPLAFPCEATDGDHAEEQCENAYPGCDVVWVFEGDDASAALSDYWG